MQQIPMDIYADMLDDRFRLAQEWLGDDKTAALWSEYLELIKECGVSPEHADPKEVVDNYVVNSEIVSREEWERGEYPTYSTAYETWDEVCGNAIVSNDEYALMQTA